MHQLNLFKEENTPNIHIFENNHKDGTLKFYIQANSDAMNRARVFVLNPCFCFIVSTVITFW